MSIFGGSERFPTEAGTDLTHTFANLTKLTNLCPHLHTTTISVVFLVVTQRDLRDQSTRVQIPAPGAMSS
uniref:Uncharacterized protein n=1 Tax=Globisporangium ultimum (strain ATCC 200006 / CBS 805.95 / DAOM BR144) TaxID=431595 RepID=K3WHR9_GLOUD